MADVYGPFLTSAWASESDWANFAPTWAPSGPIGAVAGSATTGDWAFSSSGLQVSAGTGRAWVRGFGITRSGSPPTHAVSANAHASWSRRDRLVLRRDLAAGTVTTAVKTGTAASSPTAPALTQVETGVWEEALFSFLVPPSSGTTITGVVDERTWVSPDGEGYTSWPTPTASGDVATKGYADALGTSTNTASAIVRRDGSGNFSANQVTVNATPTATTHAASKSYVDGKVPADTGWVNIPVSSGNGADSRAPQVRKIGNIVYARGGWTGTGLVANTIETVGTIPSGYEPAQDLVVSPGMSAPGSVGRMIIDSDRSIKIEPGSPVPNLYTLDGLTWTRD